MTKQWLVRKQRSQRTGEFNVHSSSEAYPANVVKLNYIDR